MDLYLRIDGQNFDNTILDTDDLSTLRGGSRALLELPEAIFAFLEKNGCDLLPIFTGASEGLALVSVDDGGGKGQLLEAIKSFRKQNTQDSLGRIVPHLNFSVSLVDPEDWGGDESIIQNVCLNSNRIHQYQDFTINLLSASDRGQEKPCSLDRKRPAADYTGKGEGGQPCSRSVKDRREFGRGLKQKFYELELEGVESDWAEGGRITFPDSFEEIVKPRPPLLSDKLANKMAVLYMDGNKFGTIRSEVGATMSGQEAFSKHLKEHRRCLLAGILESIKGSAVELGGKLKAPMETLLWGGDELMMVFPAWSALKLLEDLEPKLDGNSWAFEYDGQTRPLHHALGLVLCNHKTPIRAVKDLAMALADSAKDLRDKDGQPIGRKNSYLQYQVLLSADPPPDMTQFREQLYKTSDARAFTLPFHDGSFQGCLDLIRKFKGTAAGYDGVPLGRLLDLLHQAMEQGFLAPGTDWGAYEEWRGRADKQLIRYEASYSLRDLEKPCMGFSQSRPLMPLVHLIQLWEFVDPHQPNVK